MDEQKTVEKLQILVCANGRRATEEARGHAPQRHLPVEPGREVTQI